MSDSTAVDTTTNTKKNKWLLTRNILFALSFVMVAAINDSPEDFDDTYKRAPDTVKVKKSLAEKMKIPLHTNKLSVPMITSIESSEQEVDEGDTFTLTGSFSANQAMNNVTVKWVLPPNVQWVKGAKNSFLSQVEAGKKYFFELNLKSVSDLDQTIHLVAESQMGQSTFSNSSQFHTRLQKAMKESYERLHDRSLEYAKESGK